MHVNKTGWYGSKKCFVEAQILVHFSFILLKGKMHVLDYLGFLDLYDLEIATLEQADKVHFCSQSKYKGEHPCRSVISIKLESNFIEITLRHGCSPVNSLYIPSFFLRTPLVDYFWCLIHNLCRVSLLGVIH